MHIEIFATFFEGAKRAIASHDPNALAEFVRFPVNTPLGSLDRNTFIRRYAEVVTPCIERAMACTDLEHVSENYLGAYLAYGHIQAEFERTVQRFVVTAVSGVGGCTPPR